VRCFRKTAVVAAHLHGGTIYGNDVRRAPIVSRRFGRPCLPYSSTDHFERRTRRTPAEKRIGSLLLLLMAEHILGQRGRASVCVCVQRLLVLQNDKECACPRPGNLITLSLPNASPFLFPASSSWVFVLLICEKSGLRSR